MLILLFCISTQADSVVGVWKLDKDRAKATIDKTISNKDKATLIQMLVVNSWKEIEFQKDGTFELLAAPKNAFDYEWQRRSNNMYAIKMNNNNNKMLAEEIVLSDKNTLLWKNMMEINNLNLHFSRIGSSNVKAAIKKNNSDLLSIVHLDKVYRTKMIGNAYYYIAFGENKSYVSITSKSKNLSMSSIQDMNDLRDEEKMYNKEIDNSSLSLMDKIKKKKNLINRFLRAGFSLKNKKLISSYGFSAEMGFHKGRKAIDLQQTSTCREITAINKEHLKCNNGTEYFSYGQVINSNNNTRKNLKYKEETYITDMAFSEAMSAAMKSVD